MAEYTVVFARSARKELERLPNELAWRILDPIEKLGRTPRPRGCRKLAGAQALWRIRIGDYRVLYAVDDNRKLIDITAIRHRREAYR